MPPNSADLAARRERTKHQVRMGDRQAARARAKDPDAEFVSLSASGQVEVTIGEEIDREMIADGYKPYEREVTTQRRAAPVIRRTMTRARSSLRSGRPASRRTSSRASASSGDPDLPEPPPARPASPPSAGSTRLISAALARLGWFA